MDTNWKFPIIHLTKFLTGKIVLCYGHHRGAIQMGATRSLHNHFNNGMNDRIKTEKNGKVRNKSILIY